MKRTALLTTPPPGWYGKLPVLGDFTSRRLGQDFVDVWDRWLASGLLALRAHAPHTWLDGYLASPSWRFLLMPGVLGGAAGDQAWAGVLMPSVDRVGRYFPFTIAQSLGAGPVPVQHPSALWPWLGKLDDLAADAMHGDWSLDRLEEALARVDAMDPDKQPSEIPTEWHHPAHGTAYWYASAGQAVPRSLRSRGLPNASSLLTG